VSQLAKVGTGQLSAVTKEQLYNMLSKTRARYHKYFQGQVNQLAKVGTVNGFLKV
jgi:hypothetical protein